MRSVTSVRPTSPGLAQILKVASDVSAMPGGLPPVERTLNWVRIAAPARIQLQTPPDDLWRLAIVVRIGATRAT